ncbi:MAG: hypothetical protein AAF327_04915 [Cyanobacteria bacterium P01_A01_bin.37]
MTKQEMLMQVLGYGGWHSTTELVEEVGHRFSATLQAVKGQGWQVEKRHSDARTFEYQLVR